MVKINQLRWVGYVKRILNSNPTKQAYKLKLLRKRAPGRLRKMYIDDVESDLKTLKKND